MSCSIYGNTYDLSGFIDKHPGGEEILPKTKDTGDITALFESYHAFSNISAIRTSLEKFKVQGSNDSGEQYDFTTYNKLILIRIILNNNIFVEIFIYNHSN